MLGEWLETCPDCGSASINATDYYGDIECMSCGWVGVFDELEERRCDTRDITNSAPIPVDPGYRRASSNEQRPTPLPVSFWTEVRPRLRRSWGASGQSMKSPPSGAPLQRMSGNG